MIYCSFSTIGSKCMQVVFQFRSETNRGWSVRPPPISRSDPRPPHIGLEGSQAELAPTGNKELTNFRLSCVGGTSPSAVAGYCGGRAGCDSSVNFFLWI